MKLLARCIEQLDVSQTSGLLLETLASLAEFRGFVKHCQQSRTTNSRSDTPVSLLNCLFLFLCGEFKSLVVQSVVLNKCDVTFTMNTLIRLFNPLQGSIPDDIRNCHTLARLILKDNNLSGLLLDFWDNPNLLYLDISNKYFTRKIPATFTGMLTNITEINLSMSRLSGVLPQELWNLLQL
ncbi:receptor-like protein kinase [Tanacetum coccineum]